MSPGMPSTRARAWSSPSPRSGRGQDRSDLRPVHRVDPQRGAVPGLRADRVDQRQDRPARRTRARAGRRHLGGAPSTDLDRELELGSCRLRPSGPRHRRSVASGRSCSTTQAAIAPTFVFFASDASAGPLRAPTLSRESPARDVRVRWHPGPPRLPRPRRSSRRGARRRRHRRSRRAPGSRPRAASGRRRLEVARPADGRRRRTARRGHRRRRVGTTLARLVARVELVTLLCHSEATAAWIRDLGRNESRDRRRDLPPTVLATADPAVLMDATDLLIFATLSAHLRAVTAQVAPPARWRRDRLSVVKGLERDTPLRSERCAGHRGGRRGLRLVGSPPCPARTWPPRSRVTC